MSDPIQPDSEQALPVDLVRGIPAEEVRAAPLLPENPYGLLELVWSDYCRHYQYKHESLRRQKFLCLPRIATNSSLHATVLTRLMQGTSPRVAWLWRRLLLTHHGCDIAADAVIGPELMMPHPTGIVIGPRTVIGRGAMIGQLVTITPVTTNWRGANVANTIQIGDHVTLFAGACIFGEITVGDGAIIGAKSLVTRDVPAGHFFSPRGRIRRATAEEQTGYPPR